ncbi:MAG TPA: hypothetical protein VMT68_11595, partial [Caulobacteraceae bacterium]|nr:hypothetical protein [Caulobacteraceae bacterium]
MSNLNGHHIASEALLTRGEIEGWRAELADIEAQVAKLNARAAELGQLLNAAAVIERVRASAMAA